MYRLAVDCAVWLKSVQLRVFRLQSGKPLPSPRCAIVEMILEDRSIACLPLVGRE